ncbi:MAG TPA: hypothetical protein VFR86_00570 [Burkholderiaceae bacterium]|nr:hypothetical protein [Burkholderiaceae bacterium]
MNRATVRTAAAILAAAVTITGLKGIAVLAETAASPTTVVVLPPVVVSATPADETTQVAAALGMSTQFVAASANVR